MKSFYVLFNFKLRRYMQDALLAAVTFEDQRLLLAGNLLTDFESHPPPPPSLRVCIIVTLRESHLRVNEGAP